ncbi:MAG: hypothetical protein EA412_13165 [Chitinophagaceae bacterium]|nr:MAG: hypothetical protein EA412_13165 [Chitinophagaceae bacterium]
MWLKPLIYYILNQAAKADCNGFHFQSKIAYSLFKNQSNNFLDGSKFNNLLPLALANRDNFSNQEGFSRILFYLL